MDNYQAEISEINVSRLNGFKINTAKAKYIFIGSVISLRPNHVELNSMSPGP